MNDRHLKKFGKNFTEKKQLAENMRDLWVINQVTDHNDELYSK